MPKVSSRAVKEAASRKAKKVHFFQNGKPYASRLTVSMIPGKDFHTFDQLCNYLSERAQLLNGVQYVFTTNGIRVCTLDELEHGQSYVISSSKQFSAYPYGIIKLAAPQVSRIVSNRYKVIREDDLRLLRPLSSKYNNVYATANRSMCAVAGCSPKCELSSLPKPPPATSAHQRVLTVVNNHDHNIRSKVILNLKSPKSFENLLYDLGQSVRMNAPKRMFTSSGLEVKSVSHLKHDLTNVDLFYIDNIPSNERLRLLTKFPSLESIDQRLFAQSMSNETLHHQMPINTFSSNIDVRPGLQLMSETSMSNIELDRRWQKLDDTTTAALSSQVISNNKYKNQNGTSAEATTIAKPSSINHQTVRQSTAIKQLPPLLTISTKQTVEADEQQPVSALVSASTVSKKSTSSSKQQPSKDTTTTTTRVPSSFNQAATSSDVKPKPRSKPTPKNARRLSLSRNSQTEQPNIVTVTPTPNVVQETKVFSLEQISPEKYQQIQQYAERMLAETSNEIKREGLLLHKTKNKRTTVRESQPISDSQKEKSFVGAVASKSNACNSNNTTFNAANKRASKASIPHIQTANQTESNHSSILSTTVHPLAVKVKRSQSNIETTLTPTEQQNNSKQAKSMTAKSESKSSMKANQQQPRAGKMNTTKSHQISTHDTDKTVANATTASIEPQTVVSQDKHQASKSNSIFTNTKATISRNTTKQLESSSQSNQLKSSPDKNNSTLSNSNNNNNNNKDKHVTVGKQLDVTKTIEKGTKKDNNKTVLKKTSTRLCNEKLITGGNGIEPPAYQIELARVLGFNGSKSKNLLYLNTTNELLFHSGVLAVLWNPIEPNIQRFYTEHDQDIYCMRVDAKSEYIASCQMLDVKAKQSVIRIWAVKSLQTIAVLKDKQFSLRIIDMEFTVNNSLFVINSSEVKLYISLWNWNANICLAKTTKPLDKDEVVYGGTVHSVESDILVTYGNMHLVVWHLHKDNKTINYRTALQTHSKISKCIYCADFLHDNSLLTGDANGNLTIWAPFEVNNSLKFAIKEVKGHEVQLACQRLTKDNILISGDKEGIIKTWDVSDGEFRLINAIKLPATSGTVNSIALSLEINSDLDVYVGTSENLILRGSVLQSTEYEIVFEGHLMAIRTISFDVNQGDCFYTASLDQKVCKWNVHSLVWRANIELQAISSTVHPAGQVLAIGSVNGIVCLVDCQTGQLLQYLEISPACIGCMSYSPDGNFLVAGCQDGNLHVLPVNDDGHSYSKVSILKGPLPILTLQWSMDTQFILTSVDDNNYQELILWDLHNTRYIRNVTSFSDNLRWYNPVCSGLEDARGTWDNVNLHNVINICTHYSPSLNFIVTGDENGYLRIFSFPCSKTNSSYYEYRQGGGSVTDVQISFNETFVVSCNFEGCILVWNVKKTSANNNNTNSNSKRRLSQTTTAAAAAINQSQ